MSSNIQYFIIPTGAQTRTQICDKIAKLDLLIDSLYTVAITSVGNANIIEYEINTGQTKQRVEYSTAKQVTDAIAQYEKLRDMLRVKLTPRVVRLSDSKNFN